MGIAAKVMVVVFVVFTAINVEFASSIYQAVRGWIEYALNWVLHHGPGDHCCSSAST